MSDLVTSANFKIYAQIDHTDDHALIALLVTAVSADIERWLGRSFSLASYVEYVDGGAMRLILKKYPIVLISSIVDTLSVPLAIKNGDFAGDADDWTLGTGWSFSQNRVTHSAGTAVLSQALDATAAKSYWLQYHVTGCTAGSVTPSIGSTNGTARSADGTFDELIVCTGGSDLLSFTPSNDFDGSIDRVVVRDVDNYLVSQLGYRFDSESGLVFRVLESTSDFYFEDYPSDCSCTGLYWGEGFKRWRVEYTAGYSAVPEDIKLLAYMMIEYLRGQSDPQVLQQSEGDLVTKYNSAIAQRVKRIADAYKDGGF